jgi:dienelactone hydrolase
LYRPAQGGSRRGIVVAHGVHHRGIDEQRLVPFVRTLASSGFVVLTPELLDLADYRLTSSSLHVISAAVEYLAQREDLIDGGRVGLLGFSFAGGLSLLAATEPRVSRELEFVMSIGGHHDLDRVFRFLLTNEAETPSGIVRSKAHDYGLAILLYANLAEFLAEPELTPTRNAFRAWLHEDRATAKAIAVTLQGQSAHLFRLLEAQRLTELAPELMRLVANQRGASASLSPKGNLGRIQVPVYLLHGAHDSVIPPSETEYAHLELAGHTHDALVTPLIEHVEVASNAGLRERIAFLRFMAHLF